MLRLPARNLKKLPFTLETHLERTIAADPNRLAGIEWGQPRPGHPEGKVKFHIREVLDNVDRFWINSTDRPNLHLIALIHDSFKFQAGQIKSRNR